MHVHETNTVQKKNLHGIKPSFVNFKKPTLNQRMDQIPDKHDTTICTSIQESRCVLCPHPPPPQKKLLTYRWTEQHCSPSCWPFGWWWRCWCGTVGDTMYGAAWGNICLYLVGRILRRCWWVDWIKGRQNRTCLTPGLDQLFNCCWQNIQGYYCMFLKFTAVVNGTNTPRLVSTPKMGQCLIIL